MQTAQVKLSSRSQLHRLLWKSALIRLSFTWFSSIHFNWQISYRVLSSLWPFREGMWKGRELQTFDYSGYDRKRIHTFLHSRVFSTFEVTAPYVESFNVTKLRMVNVFSYKDQFSKGLQKRLTQHVFVCHYTHLLLILHSAVHCIDCEFFLSIGMMKVWLNLIPVSLLCECKKSSLLTFWAK